MALRLRRGKKKKIRQQGRNTRAREIWASSLRYSWKISPRAFTYTKIQGSEKCMCIRALVSQVVAVLTDRARQGEEFFPSFFRGVGFIRLFLNHKVRRTTEFLSDFWDIDRREEYKLNLYFDKVFVRWMNLFFVKMINWIDERIFTIV